MRISDWSSGVCSSDLASFLASAAGIIVSFLALAGLAVGLKAARLAVGWGIQFQQPLFLSALAVVMALFAYNLLGLFEVPLPRFVGRLAAIGSAEGAPHGPSHSLGGSFANGLLAPPLPHPPPRAFLGPSARL